MTTLHPFDGYVVAPDAAAEVVAPAYDALTPEERAAHAADSPRSFLTVLPNAHADEAVLAACRRNLEALLAAECYAPLDGPVVAVYRLDTGAVVQTAVVADLPVDAVERGEILGHERTHPGRVGELIRYLEVVGVNSSPVCLAYDGRREIDELVAEVTTGEPWLTLATDELVQQVWLVRGPEQVQRFVAAFEPVSPLFVTDGHHRTEAAVAHASGRGPGPWDRLLVALFPADQLTLLDYNRVVHDVDVGVDGLVGALRERGFHVEPLDGATRPSGRGVFSFVVDGRWLRVTAPTPAPPVVDGDVGAALDAAILQREVLGPILGVRDPESDARLEHVAGIHDLSRLDAGPRSVGVALHPTALDDVFLVARTRASMPPKSTYFSPKARSGVFVVPRR